MTDEQSKREYLSRFWYETNHGNWYKNKLYFPLVRRWRNWLTSIESGIFFNPPRLTDSFERERDVIEHSTLEAIGIIVIVAEWLLLLIYFHSLWSFFHSAFVIFCSLNPKWLTPFPSCFLWQSNHHLRHRHRHLFLIASFALFISPALPTISFQMRGFSSHLRLRIIQVNETISSLLPETFLTLHGQWQVIWWVKQDWYQMTDTLCVYTYPYLKNA